MGAGQSGPAGKDGKDCEFGQSLLPENSNSIKHCVTVDFAGDSTDDVWKKSAPAFSICSTVANDAKLDELSAYPHITKTTPSASNKCIDANGGIKSEYPRFICGKSSESLFVGLKHHETLIPDSPNGSTTGSTGSFTVIDSTKLATLQCIYNTIDGNYYCKTARFNPWSGFGKTQIDQGNEKCRLIDRRSSIMFLDMQTDQNGQYTYVCKNNSSNSSPTATCTVGEFDYQDDDSDGHGISRYATVCEINSGNTMTYDERTVYCQTLGLTLENINNTNFKCNL